MSDSGAGEGAGGLRHSRRERKAVVRVTVAAPEKKDWEPPVGEGVMLSEQPYVCEMVRKEHFKSVLLTKVHRLLYNRAGTAKKIKSSILAFSGIPDMDDAARERLFARINKLSSELLKRIMDMLGINRSALTFEDKKATKENLANRMLEWLEAPTETDQTPPSQKRKKTTTKRKKAKKRAAPKKAATKASPKKRPRKMVVDDDEGNVQMPPGILGRAGAIVRSANVAEISMRAIYTQLQEEFGVVLEKPQKKVIKSLVLNVVEEQNNA